MEGTSGELADGLDIGLEGERRVRGRWVEMPFTEWELLEGPSLGKCCLSIFILFIFIPALLRYN